MAIIEVPTLEEFQSLTAGFKKERFKLFLTWNNSLVLRPAVSTSHLDTLILRDATDDVVSQVSKSWKIFHVKEIHFDETDKRIQVA